MKMPEADKLDYLIATIVVLFLVSISALLVLDDQDPQPLTSIQNFSNNSDLVDKVVVNNQETGHRYILQNNTPYAINSGHYVIKAKSGNPSGEEAVLYEDQTVLEPYKNYSVTVNDKTIKFLR